jgi:hypothetical protein
MLDERITDFSEVGDDVIELSLGEAGVLEHSGDERAASDGRFVVGLENHTIAGAQSSRHRAHAQDKRKIEGADHSDHADRNLVNPVLLAVH